MFFILPEPFCIKPVDIHYIQLANLRLDEILIGFGFPPLIPLRLTYQNQFCKNCSARCTNNKDTCCPSCTTTTPGEHHPKFPCSGKVPVQTCLRCDKPAAHRYDGAKYEHCCKGCATIRSCTCGRNIVDPRTGLIKPVPGTNLRYNPHLDYVFIPIGYNAFGMPMYERQPKAPIPISMIFNNENDL